MVELNPRQEVVLMYIPANGRILVSLEGLWWPAGGSYVPVYGRTSQLNYSSKTIKFIAEIALRRL